MLFNVHAMRGYHLRTGEGPIGQVKEFYFDDQHWTVRYLVADTGSWLTGRAVLVSPYALSSVDPDDRSISVDLTKKQIEESPPLDYDRPVSREFEQAYYGYYGWPIYWGGAHMWGPYPTILRNPESWNSPVTPAMPSDSHLRSTQDVTGYHVHAEDGDIGHVTDFLVDEESWAIRYLVIDTSNWWPGKKVLVSSQWVEQVNWDEAKVLVDLQRETIRQAPEYTPGIPLTREDEVALHRHYARPGYWDGHLIAR